MRRVAARLPLTILKMTTHAMSGSSPANHNIRNNKACDEWLLTYNIGVHMSNVASGCTHIKVSSATKKLSFQYKKN